MQVSHFPSNCTSVLQPLGFGVQEVSITKSCAHDGLKKGHKLKVSVL